MLVRASLLFAVATSAGLALASAGCDSLTRPNDIQIIAEPAQGAAAPRPAPMPAPRMGAQGGAVQAAPQPVPARMPTPSGGGNCGG